MTDQAIDYAGARPDPATIKAHGYKGVLRYLSHSGWKNITKPEYDALLATGLTVTLNWESSAARMLGGAAAGTADGHDANAQADALGYPTDRVIYYSFDTDDRGHPGWQTAIDAYLRAAAQQGPRPVGVYGSVRVVDHCAQVGSAEYFWQCKAWSSSDISAHAHLYQRVGGLTIPDTDVNDILKSDYGQHPSPGVAPTPPPILKGNPTVNGAYLVHETGKPESYALWNSNNEFIELTDTTAFWQAVQMGAFTPRDPAHGNNPIAYHPLQIIQAAQYWRAKVLLKDGTVVWQPTP